MKRGVLLFAVALGLVMASLSPQTAAAQEGDAAEPTAPTTDEGWGDQRGIRTLQRRLFAKFGRLEFSIFGGLVPNDPFIFYMPIGLRFDYHFNEAFALEVSGSFLGCFTGNRTAKSDPSEACLRVNSDLKEDLEVRKQERTGVQQIKLLDQQVTRIDVAAMWSPFFGKVAVMNDELVHFDVNIVGGAGFLLTESLNDRLEVEFRPTIEAVVGLGFKFYFGGRFGVRADFRQYIYPKENGGTANPSEITLGFSVFTD